MINYASGAEYSLLDGDVRNDSWGECTYQVGAHIRDMAAPARLPELSTMGGGPE